MKNLNSLKKLTLILLVSFISMSCGDDGDGSGGGPGPTPTDPLDTQANLLNGNWKVKDSNSVTKDGTIVDVFTTMTLNISGGSKSGGNFSTGHNEDSGTEVCLILVHGLFRMETRTSSKEMMGL